ncbi:MAG: prepilin-type N-terminal cleavage/methylation domain-containing protein [bacterium]|nr:prepilin-type N-terminal cleavage/methylation domain-containing protein [bacterium]
MRQKGLTFIEILVVIGILGVILLLSLPALRFFEREKNLEGTAEKVLATLEEAKSNTVSSKGESSWGVSFTSAGYTFFKGSTFETRDPAFDKTETLPSSLEFSTVALEDNEAVFAKLTGFPLNEGSVVLREKASAEELQLYVNANGDITKIAPGTPSDEERIGDARHVHIEYARIIDTESETMTLTFPNSGSPVVKTIILNTYVQGSAFSWEESVAVGGEEQKLKIQTHYLNDGNNTQFSIHRDERVNTKGFSMTLSGDTIGDLIQYSDSGISTAGTSLYVSIPSLQ